MTIEELEKLVKELQKKLDDALDRIRTLEAKLDPRRSNR